MHTSRPSSYYYLALVILLAFAVWLVMAAPAPSQAGGCAGAYTVQRGDTLSAIAQKYGVNMQAIARLNGLKRPYRLQAGQTLCLPANASHARSLVTLDLGTQFGLYEPERQIEFGLGSNDESVVLRNSSDELRNSIPDDAPVVLWVARNEGSLGYTLVVVGDTDVFDQLAVVKPAAFTEIYNLARSDPGLKEVYELDVWVGDDAATRLPFEIAWVGSAASLSDARSQQRNVYLAVAGDAQDNYRLYAVVGKDKDDQQSYGPGGEPRQVKCSRWAGRRGLLYALLRWLKRC